ncbi:MAG: MarR family winged helix-turn-helix transcriptional regulator [Velocimicrobium sp.]
MEDYSRLSVLMERIIHKYNQVEQKKRLYGSNITLSRSEIHTIAAVGEHPEMNVTTLANMQGITKGAASQMIYKLVDKGFVQKSVSPTSDTQVCLTLTEQGRVAYGSHKEYHETTNEQFFALLREIPEDVSKQMEYLLEEFDKSLDEKLK